MGDGRHQHQRLLPDAAQPVEHRTHRRRLLGRFRRRAGRRLLLRLPRYGHTREHPHSSHPQLDYRHQADLGSGQHPRHRAAELVARPRRADGAHRRGLRPHPQRDRGLRRARPDHGRPSRARLRGLIDPGTLGRSAYRRAAQLLLRPRRRRAGHDRRHESRRRGAGLHRRRAGGRRFPGRHRVLP